jgi:hypothetical protein
LILIDQVPQVKKTGFELAADGVLPNKLLAATVNTVIPMDIPEDADLPF